MEELHICAANESDLDGLCRLYFDLHEFHARGVPERLRSLGSLESQDFSQLREEIRGILQDEKAVLLIAELNGEGVGKALVQAVETWAAQKGVDEIRLDLYEFAAGPLGFYEKTGYRTIKRSMVKRLGPH